MSRNRHFFPMLKRRPTYNRKKRHYNEYKDETREDCQFRCVYCDIHEKERLQDPSTRMEHWTTDHFRPKAHYPKLEHDPTNLLLSCPACNKFKKDDFPALQNSDKGHGTTIYGQDGYIDPFTVDRQDYFEILDDGSFKPLRHPAEYMIRILELNRQYIKDIRRVRILLHNEIELCETLLTQEISNLESQITQNPIPQESIRIKQQMALFQQNLSLLKILRQKIELY